MHDLPSELKYTLCEDQHQKATVNTAKFSSSGTYIVSGGSDKVLRLWNTEDGTLVKAYKGHTHEIIDAAFNNANDQLASCGGEKGINIWDIAGSDIPVRRLRGHQDKVSCIAHSQNDEVLCSGSHDATLKIWDLRASKSTEAMQTLTAAKDSVTGVYVCDTLIVACSIDGNVRVYDIRTGTLTTDCIGVALSSACLSSSGMLLAASLDSSIRLLDHASGELLNTFKGHKHRAHLIRSRFTPDEAHVYSGSEDSAVIFWDVVSGRVAHSLRHSNAACVVPCVDYHPTARCVVSCGTDGTVKVFT